MRSLMLLGAVASLAACRFQEPAPPPPAMPHHESNVVYMKDEPPVAVKKPTDHASVDPAIAALISAYKATDEACKKAGGGVSGAPVCDQLTDLENALKKQNVCEIDWGKFAECDNPKHIIAAAASIDTAERSLIESMRANEKACSPDDMTSPSCKNFDRLTTELEKTYNVCMMHDRLYADCDTDRPLADGSTFL